jgi:hypothetical protein
MILTIPLFVIHHSCFLVHVFIAVVVQGEFVAMTTFLLFVAFPLVSQLFTSPLVYASAKIVVFAADSLPVQVESLVFNTSVICTPLTPPGEPNIHGIIPIAESSPFVVAIGVSNLLVLMFPVTVVRFLRSAST